MLLVSVCQHSPGFGDTQGYNMAIQLRSTAAVASDGVKVCVYGAAGTGKTTLIATLPNPIILSAEGGLLSLHGADIPYIVVDTMDRLREAYTWLRESKEAAQYESVALDSISEVAEVVLAAEMKKSKDGRAAYGEMNTTMADMIRAFRDLPGKHVYMSAKLEKSQDETGRLLYNPSMPGKTLTQQLPYFFDELLALRVERDADGKTQRALMCDSDGLWQAKDRSGWLDPWMPPDLGAIINRISTPQTKE